MKTIIIPCQNTIKPKLSIATFEDELEENNHDVWPEPNTNANTTIYGLGFKCRKQDETFYECDFKSQMVMHDFVRGKIKVKGDMRCLSTPECLCSLLDNFDIYKSKNLNDKYNWQLTYYEYVKGGTYPCKYTLKSE